MRLGRTWRCLRGGMSTCRRGIVRTLDRSPTLPLCRPRMDDIVRLTPQPEDCQRPSRTAQPWPARKVAATERSHGVDALPRSEEHTSELQSLMRISYAVFCLKKKTHTYESHKSRTTSTPVTNE